MCEPLARQVQAFDAHATSAEPTVRVPSLPEHEQVGWWCRRQGLRWRRGRRRWRRLWRPRKRWCRRRRPVVSKRLVLVLPAEDLRGRQLHISTAELPGCCRARLPRCAPARHRAACRIGHSSLRDLRVLKEGWVSSRLLCGQLLCSRYVAGCSVASCSVAGCSVVMRPVRLVGARSLRVRLGCFTNLHRQSSRNPVPRIMWTLELQRWPHTSDACGLRPDGCVMAARLHVCSLGTLELESARADLDNHLLMGLDRAWHTILLLHLTHASRPGCHARSPRAATRTFRGRKSSQKIAAA